MGIPRISAFLILLTTPLLLGACVQNKILKPNLPARLTPGLYFIDAHSQMDQNVDGERVISLMDHGGVYRTILNTHMRRPWSEIPEFAQKYPGRIIPSVRLKGPGYHNRHPPSRFLSRLEAQLGHGGFGAMGEALIWHDSKGRFQEILIDMEDDLVQAAFRAARTKGWPFIIHIEFNALDGAGYNSYMGQLEKFLKKNPTHPMIMIHMAQLEAGPVRRLLAKHANLHFMTSHASPYYVGSQFINMFENGTLKPAWRKLMMDYPDRFVFALDNVFSKFWVKKRYVGMLKFWWQAMADLPDKIAHAVAHGNGERLWKLAPKPAGVAVYNPWNSMARLGPVRGYSAGKMNK